MDRITKVMVCVDFSDFTESIIGSAIEVTNELEPEFIFLHVINSYDLNCVRTATPYFPAPFSFEEHVEKMISERRAKLRDQLKQFSSLQSSTVSIRITTGVPYEKILKEAQTEQPDLVVMGSKGRSNLAGTLFGSNAERVFRGLNLPLLSVRCRENQRRSDNKRPGSSRAASTKIKKIVAAVDFSDYSADILRYTEDIASRCSAKVIAVNVINNRQVEAFRKIFNEQHPNVFSEEKYIRDETSKRTRKLDEMIDAWGDTVVKSSCVIRKGVPFEEIIKVVDNEEADLLVINSRGRSNMKEYLFGTTAEKAFRHCQVSVLSLNLKK